MDEELFYIILIFSVVIVGMVVLFLYRPQNRLTDDDPLQACLNACNAQFENCNQACANLGPDAGPGCDLSCTTNNTFCTESCYPQVYALRNATPWQLYFFRASGTLIDTRDGDSPYRLVVQTSDFPIIATYCDNIVNNGCDYGDPDYGIIIQDPGCYIIWYYVGYYTTDEVCARS